MVVNGKRITDYISFIWTERYNSCGDFELIVPFTSENSEFYKQDQLVTCNLSKRKMIIEKIQFSLTEENGRLMKISGRSLESIFDRRVFAYTAIYPDDYFFDNKLVQALSIAVSSSCGDLASSQYLTPYDTNPNTRSYQNAYRYEPERNIGVSKVEVLYDPYSHIKNANIYIDATGKSILELLQTHCQNKDIGFMYTGGDTVYLYDGEDKTDNVEFSYENGNLVSFDFISDSTEYKNAVYIQGEEYQARENVVTVNGITYKIKNLEKDGKMLVMNPDPSLQNPVYYRVLSKFKDFSGLSRREKFVDSSKSRGQNSDLKYGARLRAEGNIELLQSGMKTQGGAEVIHDQRFEYDVDYKLGDIVSIKIGDTLEIYDPNGEKVSVNTLKMRVSELTISHSESGLDIYPVLTAYDPSKYDASNYTDSGYDPSEDSEEISQLNYDEIVEVLCLFNGGLMDYQNITYTEGSGFGTGIEGYWYLYPKVDEGVKIFNAKNITGLYSYQQRGDYLQLPTVTLTREHYIFNEWDKDETYIIPSYGSRTITVRALWKPVIHYIVMDPGKYGKYAGNYADKEGNESVFEEWKKKEIIHSSFFVNDPQSTYNGCIVKMYEWNEMPSLKKPYFPSIITEGSGDNKVNKKITWKDWSPTPITRVDESEKRYTAQYDEEIVPDDDDKDPTNPPDIDIDGEDVDIPDHYSPDGLEGGTDPLKEDVIMAHFITPKTNKGATFSMDNSGRYVQKGSGGSVHSHYQHDFTLKFIVDEHGEKKTIDKKITMYAHLLSGAGCKNYDNNTPQGERLFYDSGFFPMHLTFINKENNHIYHDFTAQYVGFVLKIPEISFSAAPMVVQYYEHLRLKDKYIDWDVMDPIPFMPYKYGLSDGTIYQRPPSDWLTNWFNYYELNDPNGGEIGYCICYYDGDGNRIDPDWSRDDTEPGVQNANARSIEINGEVFYPYYPCTYGFYYYYEFTNYSKKRATNTIFSPYSLIYADSPSQGYGYSSDTGSYYQQSGWRFFVLKDLNSGGLIENYTGDYSSRTNQLYNNNGVGVTITCAKNIYGPGFPDKTYFNNDYPDRGQGDGKASAYYIYQGIDVNWPFTVPGATGPSGGSKDALNKMAGDTVSQVRIIKRTRDIICTSVAFARFECVAYLPGCDLDIRWQVACGLTSDGSTNWQDIPESNGKTVLFIPCTSKQHWELVDMGYEGVYQYLGTNLSEYRCVLSYQEEDTKPWTPPNPNQNPDPDDGNDSTFYDGTSIPHFGPSSYEPLTGSSSAAYHWPTSTGRYGSSFSLYNWQWAIMNSKAYRSKLKSDYKSWKPMYDADPDKTSPFERWTALVIVGAYTIEDARRIIEEESTPPAQNERPGWVEMIGTTCRIYIDDSPYPEGVVVDDNPDLEGDDSYENLEDDINKKRNRDDIPKDEQNRIVNTIKSMNGDTYPSGSARENTISVLISKYKLSTQVAAEMINVAYGRIRA